MDKRIDEPEGVKLTPEMVVAGVRRMRRSADEFEQVSGDVVLVLEILEAGLCGPIGDSKSFLDPWSLAGRFDPGKPGPPQWERTVWF